MASCEYLDKTRQGKKTHKTDSQSVKIRILLGDFHEKFCLQKFFSHNLTHCAKLPKENSKRPPGNIYFTALKIKCFM